MGSGSFKYFAENPNDGYNSRLLMLSRSCFRPTQQRKTPSCQPHKRKWRQMPLRAFCTEKFTKCPTRICHHILFLPLRPLRQGCWGTTEKELTSCKRRFAALSRSCCRHTCQRARTTLSTAQPKMATAIFGFGLTHPLPISYRGLTEKIPLSEKYRELTGQISLIGQSVGRQPQHLTRVWRNGGFTSRGQILLFSHAVGSR